MTKLETYIKNCHHKQDQIVKDYELLCATIETQKEQLADSVPKSEIEEIINNFYGEDGCTLSTVLGKIKRLLNPPTKE